MILKSVVKWLFVVVEMVGKRQLQGYAMAGAILVEVMQHRRDLAAARVLMKLHDAHGHPRAACCELGCLQVGGGGGITLADRNNGKDSRLEVWVAAHGLDRGFRDRTDDGLGLPIIAEERLVLRPDDGCGPV